MNGGKLLFQLIKIVVGFVLAMAGCGLFLAWGFFQSAHPQNDVIVTATVFGTGLVSASVIGAAALLPAGVMIAISEFGRARSVIFHLASGGGIAFLIWTFGSNSGAAELRPGSTIVLAAGFMAGAIYWFVAGRTAGCWTADRNATSTGREPRA